MKKYLALMAISLLLTGCSTILDSLVDSLFEEEVSHHPLPKKEINYLSAVKDHVSEEDRKNMELEIRRLKSQPANFLVIPPDPNIQIEKEREKEFNRKFEQQIHGDFSKGSPP